MLIALSVLLAGMLLYNNHIEKERAAELQALNKQLIAEKKQQEEERLQLIAESSFYQKLKYGFDVDLLIVGDSIGQGAGASSMDTHWTSLLQQYIRSEYMLGSDNRGEVSLTNVSMGGNSSYAGYARSLNEAGEFDLVVLCYGQNDSPQGFEVQYEALIRAVKRKNPNASIISVLESSQRGYTEKMNVINELSAHYGIQVADTIGAFNESGKDYEELVNTDGVHPNDEGYKLYFETLKAVIDENVISETGKMKEVPPVNNECLKYDSFIWYGVAGENSFTRTDDVTYQINTKAHGVMGIDYTYVSGNNKTEIHIDGELFIAPTVTFDYDFSQRHIDVVSEDCVVNNEIKVVFETREQADKFGGIGFSWK